MPSVHMSRLVVDGRLGAGAGAGYRRRHGIERDVDVRTAFQPEGIAVPPKPYSPVVVSDGLVFVSGQIPIDVDGELVNDGFEGQLVQVLDNVERCLAAADCTLADVLKATVYLTDRDQFEVLNRRYAERFLEPRPVRTTIVCQLLDERFLVEMDVIARVPGRP